MTDSYQDAVWDSVMLRLAVNGWTAIHVLPTEDDPADQRPFAYTLGLTERQQPELLISGLDWQIAQLLLAEVARRVLAGEQAPTHGLVLPELLAGGYPAVLREGTETPQLVTGFATALYGDAVQLCQIVWPDKSARFPWDDGYQFNATIQPLLHRPDETST